MGARSKPLFTFEDDGSDPERRLEVALHDTVHGFELVFTETIIVGSNLPDRIDRVAIFLPELVALVAGVGRANYAPTLAVDVNAQALLLRFADLTTKRIPEPAEEPAAAEPDAADLTTEPDVLADDLLLSADDALATLYDRGLSGVASYYNFDKGRRRKRRRGCRDTLAKLVVEIVLAEFADRDGVTGIEEACKRLEGAADQLRRYAAQLGKLV